MPRHARRSSRRRRRLRLGRLLLVLTSVLALVLVAAGVDVARQALATLPAISDPTNDLGQSSVIYDRFGHAVAVVPGPQNRQPVALSQIPPVVQHAFIAVEDRRFYHNTGIDLRGILRALLADLTGRPLQGGSTITQQLARTLYLSRADTLTRKIREAVIALELTRRYTKPEILDMYLNWIYLGERAYGVQAAAETYFGVPIQRVTLAQAALLAGLPQEPVGYDPFYHPRAALERRNTVLQLMAQQGYITRAEARAAQRAPLGVQAHSPSGASTIAPYPYPWFIDAVILQLEQRDHLSAEQVADGGLKIYTTLDPAIQQAAQDAVAALPQSVFPLDVPNPMQAAMVVLDQSDGDVVAIVGGRRHTAMLGYDRALQAERQPGSSIKPLVDYIPALRSGLTAGTVVDDRVFSYPMGSGQPAYVPQDYQLPYYGLTTLTEAVRRSVNTVAVQLLARVGVQNGFDNAVRMGLPLTPADLHLSLALGGTRDCCSPLDMATAYATIANGGARVTPRIITRVLGPDGSVLVDNPPQLRQVLDPRIAYVMTRMLMAVDEPQPPNGWDANWGTGYDATVHDDVPGWQTAAKTGTTDNNEDAWYVGYTPLYTAAVWLGYDKPQPFPGLYGGVYAGPIFQRTMEAALRPYRPIPFRRPPGVVQAPIDAKAAPWTVAAPGPLTPPQWVRSEWFVEGTQPTAPSHTWVEEQVVAGNPSVLWEPGCPGTPQTRVVLNRPPLGYTWAHMVSAALGGPPDRYIPVDMALAPPTRTCNGGPAPRLPLLPVGPPTTRPAAPAPPAAGPAPAPPAPPAAPAGQATAPAAPARQAAPAAVAAAAPPATPAAHGGQPAEATAPAAASASSCPTVTSAWRIRLAAGLPPDPAEVCVPAGQRVTLTFQSADGVVHDVMLPGFQQEAAVPANGLPVSATFTPGTAGTFELQDTPGTAGAAPQVGYVIVEGGAAPAR